MIRRHATILLPLAVALAACQSQDPVAGPVETGPDPTAPAAIETSQLPDEPDDTAAAAPPPSTPAEQRFTLDGLVGQVNGRPIYARTVFEPLDEQLTQLARENPGLSFQQPALQAIALRVNEMVQNALILGEAERDLDEQQQKMLAFMVDAHREELLRLYGRGSAALAEDNLQEERGMSLAEALEDYRQQVVVRRYLQEKLFPRINVTRRDIERYYREHAERFNPPAQRVVRLIAVPDRAAAQTIADQLAAGASFTDLALSELNLFKPGDGGRMEVTGDSALAVAALNDQLGRLEVGHWAGPFTADNGAQWFIYVESSEQPPSKPLKDVQTQIEAELREQQYRVLRTRFMQRISREGSFTPVDVMIARLYGIAEARYAVTP